MTTNGAITDSAVCHGGVSPQITHLKLQHIFHTATVVLPATATMFCAQIQPLVQKMWVPVADFCPQPLPGLWRPDLRVRDSEIELLWEYFNQ